MTTETDAGTREVNILDLPPPRGLAVPLLDHALDIRANETLERAPIHWTTPTGEIAVIAIIRTSTQRRHVRAQIRAYAGNTLYHVHDIVYPKGAKIDVTAHPDGVFVFYEDLEREREVEITWDGERRCPIARRH